MRNQLRVSKLAGDLSEISTFKLKDIKRRCITAHLRIPFLSNSSAISLIKLVIGPSANLHANVQDRSICELSALISVAFYFPPNFPMCLIIRSPAISMMLSAIIWSAIAYGIILSLIAPQIIRRAIIRGLLLFAIILRSSDVSTFAPPIIFPISS
jgi:hypothetical protein